MAQQVEMRRISKHKKQRVGVVYANSKSTNRTLKDGGQYVFITGTGSKRRSETKHMTEAQAIEYKDRLERG